MAAASHKRVEAKTVRHHSISVRLATDHDQAALSPALQQQALLQDELKPLDTDAKWSPRRTLAFAGLTCGGFWLCVLIGLTRGAH